MKRGVLCLLAVPLLAVWSLAGATDDVQVSNALERVEVEKLRSLPDLSLSSDGGIGFRGDWNLGANLRLEWNLFDPEGEPSLKAAQAALKLAQHNSEASRRVARFETVRTALTYLYLEEVARNLQAARERLEVMFPRLSDLARQFMEGGAEGSGTLAGADGSAAGQFAYLELLQTQHRTARELEEFRFQLTGGTLPPDQSLELARGLAGQEPPAACTPETDEVVRARLLLEEAAHLEALQEAGSKPRVVLHGTAGARAYGALAGSSHSSPSTSLSTGLGVTVSLPKAGHSQGSARVQVNTTGVNGSLSLRFQRPSQAEPSPLESAQANLDRALREANFAMWRNHSVFDEAHTQLQLASLKAEGVSAAARETAPAASLVEAVTAMQEDLEGRISVEAALLERDLALLDLQLLCGVI